MHAKRNRNAEFYYWQFTESSISHLVLLYILLSYIFNFERLSMFNKFPIPFMY